MAQKLKRKRTEITRPRKVFFFLTNNLSSTNVVKAARINEVKEEGISAIDCDEESEPDGRGTSDIVDQDEDNIHTDEDSVKLKGASEMQDPSLLTNHRLVGNERKPPDGEELRTMREASDLFKSSSFKLQVCQFFFSSLNCELIRY